MITGSIGLPKRFKKLVAEEFINISEAEFNKLKKFQSEVYGGSYVMLSEDKESYTLLPYEMIRQGFYFLKPQRNNWISIKKASDCLFSRRLGIEGKIIFGYSVCIRLLGRTII